MSPLFSISDDATRIKNFWNNYLSLLEKYHIPEKARPWYRRHVESYIEVYSNQRLATHTPANLESYLSDLGRQGHISDWQFRQCADALRILFCEVVQSEWASRFDWDAWQFFSVQLDPSHATLIREDVIQEQLRAFPKGSLMASFRDHYPDLMQQIMIAIRVRSYSSRTEQTYLMWMTRFLIFHGWKSPDSLDSEAVRLFLEHLAVERKVSSSTQNLALNALVFLYRDILKTHLEIGDFVRAKQPRRLPVVLTKEEMQSLLGQLNGQPHLMAALMYGTGMRLMECVRLRVKDIDFNYKQIVIRFGKG